MKADALLNAYIDLNLLVLAGALLWLVARTMLRHSAAAFAYKPQLRLLNSMTVFLAVAPFLSVFIFLSGMGRPPNLSDMLVSQYLQGNVSMSASKFETLIGLREDLVRAMVTQAEPWTRAALALILLGGCYSLARFGLAIWQLHRSLKQTFVLKSIGRVRVLLSDTAPVAYSTRGLTRLYVVLPTSLLNDMQDLRFTLAHELQHFRQRDVETAFLIELLRPFLLWNPAFHLWRRDMRSIREFACDQALRDRGRFDARAYCECLIRASSNARKTPVFLSERGPMAALIEQRQARFAPTLARRIIAVTEAPLSHRQGAAWAVVCGLFMLTVLATAILIQRPADWSHDRIMLSTIVNLERMESRRAAQTSITALNGGFMAASN